MYDFANTRAFCRSVPASYCDRTRARARIRAQIRAGLLACAIGAGLGILLALGV